MVRAAFDHGLHVFCEKPLTLTAGDSDELTETAAARGRSPRSATTTVTSGRS